jgi:small nuclear ribonucleoprotein (snRNP)-like protein
MKRTTAIMAIVLTITVLTSTVSPVVFAQQPARGDWTAVQSVALGDEVSVKLKDGHKLRGRFSSANETELTMLRKSKQQPIAKDTIAQVYRLERRAEKAKYAAIGAGIGAAVGGGIGGAKAAGGGDDSGIYTVIGLIFGTGFGALGGVLWGAAKRKHVLIYEAP